MPGRQLGANFCCEQAQQFGPRDFSRVAAVILVHNHPGGDPTPSRADIDMTLRIIEIARGRGIEVHDHIIVGRDGHASLKGLKLI